MLTDFQKFALPESTWKLLQNSYSTTYLTLGMLLHYLGKLEIQIFCKYVADTEENVNKLQFSSSVNLFAVYLFKYKLLIKILSSSLNTMLIVDKHCFDEFPVPRNWSQK